MVFEIDLDLITSDNVKSICADKCGAKCCRRVGTDFQVPVSISEYQRLKRQELDHFINWNGPFPSLRTSDEGACVFLTDDSTCGIYKIRPKACSEYPFRHLKENIDDFCLLYHNSPIQYRTEQKQIAESDMNSSTSYLFDVDQNEKIAQEYYSKFS